MAEGSAEPADAPTSVVALPQPVSIVQRAGLIALQPLKRHWKVNELVNHQLNSPTIPSNILRSQDHLRDALKAAITKDDAATIQSLIRQGAPLYRQYFHGPAGPGASNPYLQKLGGMVNPVDWAALELRFRAAMVILEMGDGRLMHTEARPRPAKFEELRLAGDTKMALSTASKHGHLGLMRMLLERGCPVGQKDVEDMSCLRVATQTGRADAISLLLQYGAWQVEERPDEVLAVAKEKGLLETFVAFGVVPVEGIDTLQLAASGQQQLEAPTSRPGWSPPASKPNTPSAGARREACFKDGYSNAISKTAGASRLDSIADSGWSPHGSLPWTPLAAAAGGAVSLPTLCAAAAGSSETGLYRELTSVEVRLRGELTRAIRKGDLIKVEGLVGRGAPLEAALDLGYGERGNCIDWACVCGKPEMVFPLLSLADKKGIGSRLAIAAKASFFWSVTQGYPEVLEELLRCGSDVGQKVPGNQSALGAAVFGTRSEEVVILLKYGAWDRESEAQRAQLWEWARCRKAIAAVFQQAGLQNALDKSSQKRLEAATPTTRAPTAMTSEGERPETG